MHYFSKNNSQNSILHQYPYIIILQQNKILILHNKILMIRVIDNNKTIQIIK